MEDNNAIQKEIALNLSECLDLSIKAYCYGSNAGQDDSALEALHDLLYTLHQLEAKLKNPEKITHPEANPDCS